MGTRIKPLDKLCSCGSPLQLVTMKNPYLDDSETECTNPKCSRYEMAHELLNARARSNARRDEE